MDSVPAIVISMPANQQLQAAPIPKDWIVEGDPQARSSVLSRSTDGTTITAVWETTKGTFRWHFAVDETINVLEGEVFVTDEKNVEHRLGPGDVAYFPGGSWSTWRVPERMRKIAFVRHGVSGPAALVARGWSRLVNMFSSSKPPTPMAIAPVAHP